MKFLADFKCPKIRFKLIARYLVLYNIRDVQTQD